MTTVRKRPPRASKQSGGRLEKRRERFIKEAEALFLRKGYAGVSVNEIVRRAGGSLATLYSEFGSKELLFCEVMRQLVSDLFGSNAAQCRKTNTLRASLVGLATRLLEQTLSKDGLAIYRIAISEGPHFPDLRDAILEVSLPQFLETLGGILVELDVSSSRDRIGSADLFVTLIQGRLLFRAACGGRDQITKAEIDAHAGWAVDAFLRARPGKMAGQVRKRNPAGNVHAGS